MHAVPFWFALQSMKIKPLAFPQFPMRIGARPEISIFEMMNRPGYRGGQLV
jgi:hypothetical protein